MESKATVDSLKPSSRTRLPTNQPKRHSFELTEESKSKLKQQIEGELDN